MAEIQLKKNWAGYVPGSIKSVSDERGAYLVKEGIARYTPEQKEKNLVKAKSAGKKADAKAKKEADAKAKKEADAKAKTEKAKE